jgi:hypothetical protein
MADLHGTGLSELERFRIRMLAEEHFERTRGRTHRSKLWVSGHWRKKAR